MVFLKKKQLKNANYLELIPIRIAQEVINDDHTVSVLLPKFKSNFAKKHIVPRLRFPFIKLNLDLQGSFTWLAIDGKKTVKEIAIELENQFKNQSIEKQLTSFLTQLFEHKLIQFVS